jgi:hypothetical protein
MKRDPAEPNFGFGSGGLDFLGSDAERHFRPGAAEACTDIGADAWTDGLERRAYRAGWRWGLLCGLTAGVALVGAMLLIGLKAGAA